MPVYKMPSESTLVNNTMRLLSFYESSGLVVWFTRLQSGSVKVIKRWGAKRYENWMRLCRRGTPDVMAVMNTGEVLWLELKTKKGIASPDQEEFKAIVGKVDGHHHMFLRNIDDLEEYIKETWK